MPQMPQNKEPAGPRYSLWLIPEGEDGRQLADIIARLSERFGTPTFDPHVTLLGGLLGPEKELVTRISQITRSMRPRPTGTPSKAMSTGNCDSKDIALCVSETRIAL